MSFRHICYQHPVPREIEEKLIGLYQSAFCVPEYFQIYREVKKADAISIYSSKADPDQIVFYVLSGKEAVILNEYFEIGKLHLQYLAEVLFDRHRALHTIHLANVRSDFKAFSFFHEIWRVSDDCVVELPKSMSEYRSRLGKRTKANMNNYRNKLSRSFSDFCFSVMTGEEIDKCILHKIIDLNRLRMLAKGTFSAINDEQEAKMYSFSRAYGIAASITMDGGVAAGTICYQVGDHCYADVIAHDQAYNQYSVGRVCVYLLIEALISRGVRFFHLGGGEDDYKSRMLGISHDVYTVSIFRNKLARMSGIIKHVRKYKQVDMYLKMLKYNYLWRFKHSFLQKIRMA